MKYQLVGTVANGNILVEFTPEDYETFQAWYQEKIQSPEIPDDEIKDEGEGDSVPVLDIPHLKQNSPSANWSRNDCGAACIAMCVNGLTDNKVTVDEVAKLFMTRNQPMQLFRVVQALQHYGLQARYERPLKPDQVREAIQAGKPIVALMKYSKLPQKLQAIDYRGSHYIVVYGGDQQGFNYHDPLAGSGGFYLTNNELNTTMSGFDAGENMPYQGVIVG